MHTKQIHSWYQFLYQNELDNALGNSLMIYGHCGLTGDLTYVIVTFTRGSMLMEQLPHGILPGSVEEGERTLHILLPKFLPRNVTHHFSSHFISPAWPYLNEVGSEVQSEHEP